ncbi:MAG: MarR family winged helix-turn-helix transcriptional regulator [Sphingomonas sp.]
MSELIMLLRVATLIHKPMRDGVADPLGLGSNELRILMALGGEGAMAGFELSDMIGLPPMNVSRALDSLQRMGLVEPLADERNRRRKPHQLSKAGWKAFHESEARTGFVAEFLFSELAPADRAKFAELLGKLDRRIGEWRTPETKPRAASG